MNMSCERCGYKWDYRGNPFKVERIYISCPNCKTCIKLRELPPLPKKKNKK